MSNISFAQMAANKSWTIQLTASGANLAGFLYYADHGQAHYTDVAKRPVTGAPSNLTWTFDHGPPVNFGMDGGPVQIKLNTADKTGAVDRLDLLVIAHGDNGQTGNQVINFILEVAQAGVLVAGAMDGAPPDTQFIIKGVPATDGSPYFQAEFYLDFGFG